MIDARHRWVFPEPLRLDPEVRAAARALGLGTFAATVLARRGIADPAAHGALPRPGRGRPERPPPAARRRPPGRAHPPRASSGGERVMVFGDFDADGLTGLAQLVLAFRRLGLDTVPVRPVAARGGPRPLDGRGRDGGRARAIALIVTVDTGSTSVAEIAAAAARGIDVIITDHHHLPDVLPAAVAIVNPQRADSAYPDRRLSGSRRRVHGRAAAARRAGRRGGGGARARGPRDDRDGVGRRAGARREPVDRAARARADADGAAARDRGAAREGRRRARHGRPRDRRASCSRRGSTPPAGWGRRSTPPGCCSPRRPRRRPTLAAILEEANVTRKRPHAQRAIAEARAAFGLPDPGQAPGQQAWLDAPGARPTPGIRVARRPRRRRAARDRPVARRDHRPRRGPPRRRDRTPGDRGHVLRAPGGDVIRASCRSDGRLNLAQALDACGDLFVRHGGHAAAAGFELPARALGRVRRAVPRRGGGRDARTDARRPLHGGPRAAGRVRRLRPVPRPRPARPVRDRQPGAARRRRSG